MKNIFLSIGVALLGFKAVAQHDPQFSQNMFMKLLANPAYAGTSGVLGATAAYREESLGVYGNPKGLLFLADAPVKFLHGGLGVIALNNMVWSSVETNGRLAYSFHKNIGQSGLLAIGLDAGVMRFLMPELHSTGQRNIIKYYGNTDLGVYYKTKQWYAGLSVSHVPKIDERIFNVSRLSETFERRLAYGFMAGYEACFWQREKFMPSLLVKSDGHWVGFDLNIKLIWDDFFWGGISYRYDAFVPMGGLELKINKNSIFKIGYSQDIGVSYRGKSHEILANYSVRLNWK